MGSLVKVLWITLGVAWASHAGADAASDYDKGLSEAGAKQWAEAAQDFMRATAQDAGLAKAWKQLATSRWYLGDYEGAAASADRYLDLDPTDTAFSDWADGLRKQLGLPPRAVPTPSPEVTPTPQPQPSPDTLVAPPPAPDNEAVAVPLEAAAAIDDDAQQQAAALAAGLAPRSAHVGLRLLGAWALGFGAFQHGEAVADPAHGSGTAYQGAPAGGSSGAAEALLDLGSHVELSVGIFPCSWNDSRDSMASGSTARSNSSDAAASFLPLLASLGWRQPVGEGWTLLALAGGGSLPATRVSVHGQTVQTSGPGALTVTTLNATYDYPAAPAWRAELGAEWSAGDALSLHVGLQALGATLASTVPAVTAQAVDQANAPVALPADTVLPASQGLNLLQVDLLLGLTLRY